MKLTTTVPLGDNAITIEAEGMKQLFMASGFFGQIPQQCGNCGGKNLILSGKKNSGYEFYSVLCLGCKHELKFGQRREDGGLFLKEDDGWQPPFSGGGGGGGGQQQGGYQQQQQQQGPPPQQQPPQGGGMDDDIPF